MRVYNYLSVSCQTKETYFAQKNSSDGAYYDVNTKRLQSLQPSYKISSQDSLMRLAYQAWMLNPLQSARHSTFQSYRLAELKSLR